MSLTLYAHPFSSYCQKVLIALYADATPFTYRAFGPDDPGAWDEFVARWPLRRFPLLVDDTETVAEASVIVEHLATRHPGANRWLPADADAAREVRTLDRLFDNYVMTPMQKFVLNQLRPEADRDAYGVAEARGVLERIYAWLDVHLAGREWAAGDAFTLADCAAAPSLFYADWVHEIPAAHARLRAYRARLLGHPSVARAIDEARPYRQYFPLGAPNRD